MYEENCLRTALEQAEALCETLTRELAALANYPQWVPVGERLPEDSDSAVLAIVNGKPQENITLVGAYQFATYSPAEGWIIDEYPEWETAIVTHWMPMPEPPKGENHE